MLDEFLENDATTEEAWIIKETYKRRQLWRLALTIVLLLVFCVSLIICDVLFFKSIIVSVISGVATILGILLKVLKAIKNY